jgi:hypothetical protein
LQLSYRPDGSALQGPDTVSGNVPF